MKTLKVLRCVWQRSHLKKGELCALEVNQHERYDGFAHTQALKVFPTSKARAASQRHTERRHRQITTILDTCFRTDTDEMKHARPPREIEHSGARRAARLWQVYFRKCWMERKSDGAKCVPQSRGFEQRRRCELVWAQGQFHGWS